MATFIVPIASPDGRMGDEVRVSAVSETAAVSWVTAELAKGDAGSLPNSEHFEIGAPREA